MKRTLIYGGTFDPPHLAHVRLPHDAMVSLEFERVLYIPAFQSPLKEESPTSAVHRLTMLELAIEDAPWAEISTIELNRSGTSYTIDTIESLINNGEELRLLIGADQWKQFQLWHRWEEIVKLANPAIMPRSGIDVDDTRLLSIEPLPAASTNIRSLIERGGSIESFVCPKVSSYIAQHALYL